MSHDTWVSTATSHNGSIRHVNEDAFLNEPNVGLWCVADGMGGHLKGDVASAIIVQKLAELIVEPDLLCVDAIELAVQQANAEIVELSQQLGDKVGSTVAILYIQQDIAHVLWAGDSRIYRFSDDKLIRLTTDHNQAEELLSHGFLTPTQAKQHPGANLVTRAVGTNRTLTLEHKTIHWKRSDVFVVCTDGLTDTLEEEAIEAQLKCQQSSEVSHTLLECALESWAKDNVTVISIHST